jgi:hypothetical protein
MPRIIKKGDHSMKQIDTGHYVVSSGEQVTLRIESHQVAEDLAVSLDGNPLDPSSSNPAIYTFDAASTGNAQFIDIECHFSASDPDDAFYSFSVKGSLGGSAFNASSVRKRDDDWEGVLQFNS